MEQGLAKLLYVLCCLVGAADPAVAVPCTVPKTFKLSQLNRFLTVFGVTVRPAHHLVNARLLLGESVSVSTSSLTRHGRSRKNRLPQARGEERTTEDHGPFHDSSGAYHLLPRARALPQ